MSSQSIKKVREAKGNCAPRAWRALIRMPCEAATPVPTMTAVGVARPSAQGHAMTSTAMPNSSANRNALCPSGSQSAGYQCRLPAVYLRDMAGQRV